MPGCAGAVVRSDLSLPTGLLHQCPSQMTVRSAGDLERAPRYRWLIVSRIRTAGPGPTAGRPPVR